MVFLTPIAYIATWYYYATTVTWVADSTHLWTLQPLAQSDLACRLACDLDPLCVQYLVEHYKRATGCYTAEVDFGVTSSLSKEVAPGFIIAQKTTAVDFSTYSLSTVQHALASVDISKYYLCFSLPNSTTIEDPSSTCGIPLTSTTSSRAADGSICSTSTSAGDVNYVFGCSNGVATNCLPGSGINGKTCSPCTDMTSYGQLTTYGLGGRGNVCKSCGDGSYCSTSSSSTIGSCDNYQKYGFNAATSSSISSCSLCKAAAPSTSTSPCPAVIVDCSDYSSICSKTTGYILNCQPGYSFSGVTNTASAACVGCSQKSITWSAGGQLTCQACLNIPQGGFCDPTTGYLNQCPPTLPLYTGTPGTSTAKCGNACLPGKWTDSKSDCQICSDGDSTENCDNSGNFLSCQTKGWQTSFCGCRDPALLNQACTND